EQIIAARSMLRYEMNRMIMRLKYGFLVGLGLLVLYTDAISQGSTEIKVRGKVSEEVKPGVDNLVAQHWAPLKGKHVGIITHHTGMTKRGRPDPALFASAREFKLAAIFAPEHGLFGERQAGAESNTINSFYG